MKIVVSKVIYKELLKDPLFVRFDPIGYGRSYKRAALKGMLNGVEVYVR